MTGTQPIPKTGVFTASLNRQIPCIAHLVELVHHRCRHLPGDNGVRKKAPDGDQDAINATNTSDGLSARTRYQARSSCGLVLQPRDEQAQIACSTAPITPRGRAPPKEQRDTLGIGLRGGLGAIATKSKLP